MFKVRTTEQFIQRAREVHGDYYDYSKSVYIKHRDKVIIICPIHGEFLQAPSPHINNPTGCPKCRRVMPRKKAGMIKRDPALLTGGQRQCSCCGRVLGLTEFHSCKKVKDGLSPMCKKCMNKAVHDYRVRNLEGVMEKDRIYGRKRWKIYTETHKEEIEEKKRKREIFLEERRKIGKIARLLRQRLREVMKNKPKTTHMTDLLGCSLEYFMFYIESQFKEGMTWGNRSYYGWHLDHVIPCASFDLTKIEEQKKCFHYTNFQPLWRKPNQQKGSLYKGKRYGIRH